MKIRKFTALLAVSAVVFGASAAVAAAGTLNGAGSTFSTPFYSQFANNLKSKGLTLNYQSIGSGAGITQFTNGTVDFGATDPPLTDKQIGLLLAKGGPVLNIPMAFGGITVSYNVPGVKGGIRLDGPTIANIFLGKITNWNDPAIKKNNPKVKFPTLTIRTCHRSDSSGTTAGFTTFLSKYSAEWLNGPSSGAPSNTAKWPNGTGAAGNAGVAGCVKQADGGIGYVEQAYAIQNKFTYATVKNRKKEWIYPKLASVALAGTKIKLQKSLRFTAIDNPVKGAYPIVSQTFLVVYRNVCAQKGVDAGKASDILGLVNYAYGKKGSGVLRKLFYAPIPADLQKTVNKQIKTVTCNGAKIKATKF